jgi:hypothetical protein
MRGQRGQTTAEYMGLLVLVAAIVAALGAIGLGGLIGDAVKHSICLMAESLDAECQTEASKRDPNAPNGDLAPNRPPAMSTQFSAGDFVAGPWPVKT